MFATYTVCFVRIWSHGWIFGTCEGRRNQFLNDVAQHLAEALAREANSYEETMGVICQPKGPPLCQKHGTVVASASIG
jgi:hypothetical protein